MGGGRVGAGAAGVPSEAVANRARGGGCSGEGAQQSMYILHLV